MRSMYAGCWVLVTGYTHPIKLVGAKTAKGIINTNEAQLGYV